MQGGLTHIPSDRNGMGLHLLVGIALGLAIGCLASLDPLLWHRFPAALGAKPITRWMAYPAMAAIAIFAVLALPVALHRTTIFRLRYRIALAMLIVSVSLTGLNIGRLDPSDVALLGVLLCWAITGLVERRPVRLPPVVMLLLGCVVIAAIASAINGRMMTLLRLRIVVTKVLLFALVVELMASEQMCRFAVRLIIGIGSALAFLAIASMALYATTGYALSCDPVAEARFKLTTFGPLLRATATLGSAQTLAHFLVLATALAIFVPMRARNRYAAVLLMAIGVGCTLSVGAYATLSALLLAGPILRRPAITVPYLLGLVALAIVAYLTGIQAWLLDNVLVHLGGRGGADRLTMYQVGIAALERHPILGLGFGNTMRVLHTPIHNTYLQLMVTIGIPGGLLFITLAVYIVTKLGALLAAHRASPFLPMLKAGIVCMITMSIHWMTEPFHNSAVSWMYMGMATAILVVGENSQRRRGAVE